MPDEMPMDMWPLVSSMVTTLRCAGQSQLRVRRKAFGLGSVNRKKEAREDAGEGSSLK